MKIKFQVLGTKKENLTYEENGILINFLEF